MPNAETTHSSAALLRSGSTLADLQQWAMGNASDKLALVVEKQTYTYQEFSDEVNRVAAVLTLAGVKRGDGLAVLSLNRAEVVFMNWAAQRLGVRYTPLHPRGSESDHVYILEKARISILLVDAVTFADRGRSLSSLPMLRHIFTIGAADFGTDLRVATAGQAVGDVEIAARAEDICNIFFTGGTTGKPKGVAHRHASIVAANMLSLAIWDWPQEIRFLLAAPVSHAGGAMLTPTLMRGGEFHMMTEWNPVEFLKAVQDRRITASFLVPTMIYDLLDCPQLGEFDLSSLKMIIYGASSISPTRLREAIERIGPVFCQLYGQTEAPNLITYLSKEDHNLSRPELLQSCGRPVPGVQVRLLKSDGAICLPGESGELCLRGPIVMEGYWEDPDQTREVLAGDWLHTGDVARQDKDGYLFIVDRVKDMIISGGFNVFSREVEDCLMEHPAVNAVAVVGTPHPRWGETVAAFVVLSPGAELPKDELSNLVRTRKGDVQVPRIIRQIAKLPLTAVGKIDKKFLRALLVEAGA